MYKLYYDRGCANMATHAALEEIGVPFELIRVDLDTGEQRSPWYRKLHPLSRVPVLVIEGTAIYESAATLLYVCDRHPEAALSPMPDDPMRPRFLQWIFHFTVVFQETMMHWFHPDFYSPKIANATVAEFADTQTDRHLARLNDELDAGGPYVLGDRFSACDLQLAMIAYWSRHLQSKAFFYPAIRRCVELVVVRPAYRRMMRTERITWPFDKIETADGSPTSATRSET